MVFVTGEYHCGARRFSPVFRSATDFWFLGVVVADVAHGLEPSSLFWQQRFLGKRNPFGDHRQFVRRMARGGILLSARRFSLLRFFFASFLCCCRCCSQEQLLLSGTWRSPGGFRLLRAGGRTIQPRGQCRVRLDAHVSISKLNERVRLPLSKQYRYSNYGAGVSVGRPVVSAGSDANASKRASSHPGMAAHTKQHNGAAPFASNAFQVPSEVFGVRCCSLGFECAL